MDNDKIIEKLAEYLSIAPYLTQYSPDSQYQRANQLALELAVWLDETLYEELGIAIANPSISCNPLILISKARNVYGNGVLSQDKIIQHAPGIGKKEKP